MEIKVGKHTVEITHPDKILFKKPDIAKEQIIEYYEKISEHMLPFMFDRPVMMHRFPDGAFEKGFFQKNAAEYFPSWIKTISVKKKEGGSTDYVLCQNKETLIYLANQDTIAFHLWLSEYPELHKPNKLVFDLDAAISDFSVIKKIAVWIRDYLLKTYDLKSFVMTTGSRGLHVVVPLKPKVDFDEAKAFATHCAQELVKLYPDDLTLDLRISDRGKKVFIDILRNQFTATSIAPYSIRARPGAPVAVPLEWSELHESKLESQTYNIFNVFERIKKKKYWQDYNKSAKELPKI